MQDDGEITRLLGCFHNRQPEAEARLMELMYRELRKIAAGRLRREGSVRSLQATELVHEVYLRLIAQADTVWRDRAHFYQAAAHVMRQIMIDRARRRRADKRGGGGPQMSLDKAIDLADARSGDLLALDDALSQLHQVDARQCQVVEMRFFGRMSEAEIAEALGVSERTINREWRMARAWLQEELSK
jgi:RNA polymerase sigma factor (TIGR02999 family)